MSSEIVFYSPGIYSNNIAKLSDASLLFAFSKINVIFISKMKHVREKLSTYLKSKRRKPFRNVYLDLR